ncbi:MAG: hypothetical protein AB8B51_11405 [Sedimentitalea sp.]
MIPVPVSKKRRDPRRKKARDLARQRKIACNGSDKAARKHAPLIKALANRRIRRIDAAQLDADTQDNADQMALQHRRKAKHWGSDNAAQKRAAQRDKHDDYRATGGRKAVQARNWRALRDRLRSKNLNETVLKALDAQHQPD